MADGLLGIPQDEQRHSEQGSSLAGDGATGLPRAAPSPAAELPVATLLVVAALAAALGTQGGYYRSGQWAVGGLLAVAAVLLRRPARSSTALRGPMVRVGAALAAWSVTSAALAGDWTGGLSIGAILAGGVIVVVACERLDRQQRDQLMVAVVAIGVLVAVTGWAGVAWHRTPWALKDQGLWRAATTLTYANAAAGFLAVVTLLCVARSSGTRRSPLGAGANCVLLTGLGLTLSRGGFLAFLAGGLVLARLLGVSEVIRTAAAPAMGALVAVAGAWPSIPASSPARPATAALALGAGVLVAVGAARLRPQASLTLAVTGALVLTVVGAGPARHVSRRITAGRVSIASPDRVEETRAALRLAASRPVAGVGPGNAHLSWVRSDGAVLIARYAHNEYVQVLAELGVVGLGLLLTLLAVLGRTVRRSRRAELPPAVWAGVCAGLVALGVHGLFDFGWHLPAIALTGALLVGIVTTSERKDQA